MKRLVILIFVLIIFSNVINVYAEDNNDIYTKYYKSSGVEEIKSQLSDDVVKILDEIGVDPSSYNSVLNLNSGSLWAAIKNVISGGFKQPLTAFSLCVSVIIISSMVSGMWVSRLQISETYSYVCILSLATAVLVPLVAAVNNCIAVIKTISNFMLAFVPIYGGLLVCGGQITSGALYQSTMLVVCETIAQLTSQLIAPLISIYICIGMSAALSGIEGAHKLALVIKSAANWIIGFVMTFFTGFLSVQSVVSKSADNLTIKTSRFFVGSAVPVVGGALSEALTTVTASIGLLKSSVMAWFLIVIAIILLPVIAEMFVWRIVISLLSVIGTMFSVPEASKLFDICSVAISFLIGILLTISVMFILSLVIIK